MLLLRNLLVARLVSIEDYGIAATFAISMAVVEMMSGFGLQQLIIQDEKGDKSEFQAGLQGFNILRGMIAGGSLFFLSGPIALFLGVPEITWAYQLLALIPFIRGFEHFDVHRLNRNMKFLPLILTKTIPALLAVLSIWPLYHFFEDYRIMLYSVLLQWVLFVFTSHWVAKQKYQFVFNQEVMRQGVKFGWPLLVNNIALFAVLQGDRIIVGREAGLEILAIFSMGVTLTMSPTLVSSSSEQQFFLPQLAACKNKKAEFERMAVAAMQTSLISGVVFIFLAITITAPLSIVILGEKYSELVVLLPWMAIWQAARTFKIGNTTVSLSYALTANAMIANCTRILALPIAWYILANGGEIIHLIWVATLGELLAYFVSLVLVVHRIKLNLFRMIPSIALTSISLATASIYALQLSGYALWNEIAIVGLIATIIGSFYVMKEMRRAIFISDQREPG